jgi:uncharacterized protein YPO0396
MKEIQFNSGYHFQYLEILNWGTFHQKVWRIEPGGANALLTGDIGSGKSTLVDAITTLLVPNHRITYNKAAGAEGKERTLRTYIKGEYKKEKSEVTQADKSVFLRNEDDPDHPPVSILLGCFHNTVTREYCTLAQVHWMKQGQPDKLLLISGTPLHITDHFNDLNDISALKKRLKQLPATELFDDSFSKYSERFRRLLGMNSSKAIDLFYQTVSMKSVQSLNDFVRNQMLEQTDVKQRITDLKKQFENLDTAHKEVVKAREQLDILKPLTENIIGYGAMEKQLEEIQHLSEAAPAWFAHQEIRLQQEKRQDDVFEKEKNLQQLDGIKDILQQLRTEEQNYTIQIRDNGGNRIEDLKKEIQEIEKEKKRKQEEADRYHQLTAQCGLQEVNEEDVFFANMKAAAQKIHEAEQQKTELDETLTNLALEKRTLTASIEADETELKSLRQRENQLPDYVLYLRQQLCEDLETDIEALPFAGELLQVREEEREWEGAVERLLGSFGLNLLVPDDLYRKVSHYINARTLRDREGRPQRLHYCRVNTRKSYKMIREADIDSVINKVDIKPGHRYADWLEEELYQQYNLRCIDIEDFERAQDAITIEGQIKRNGYRHVKDDRRRIGDRRHYVLGWSNKDKIKAIEKELQQLRSKEQAIIAQQQQMRQQLEQLRELTNCLRDLQQFKEFSRLNWRAEAWKLEQKKQELHDIMTGSDILRRLEEELHKTQSKIEAAETEKTSITETKARLESAIEACDIKIKELTSVAESITDENKAVWFPKIAARINEEKLTLRNIELRREDLRSALTGRNGEREQAIRKQNSYRENALNGMNALKQHSPAETSELPAAIDARAEYLLLFEKISRDDLPRHEARFKEELEKKTIQGIALFDNVLDNNSKEIKKRIDQINENLRMVQYNTNPGTYIKIETTKADDHDINTFREELKQCYSHTFGNTANIYTEEKYQQVKKILDRFSSVLYADEEWAKKVTDVRQWFTFNAIERFETDDSEKEFYPGSSGKSGGQREKLAYTILASALAYQYGLTQKEQSERSFRFVMIDEAFGRGSDESTRYGLELFKKLGLQLLIVTPLQKINVIEHYVNAVHFVSNPTGQFSQVSNLTYDEYQEKKKEFAAAVMQSGSGFSAMN